VTWRESLLPPEAVPTDDDDFWTIVTSLAVDPRDSNIVYVTGSGGIFKSTHGGATWAAMNSGLAPYACVPGDNCFEPLRVISLVIDLELCGRIGQRVGGHYGYSWRRFVSCRRNSQLEEQLLGIDRVPAVASARQRWQINRWVSIRSRSSGADSIPSHKVPSYPGD